MNCALYISIIFGEKIQVIDDAYLYMKFYRFNMYKLSKIKSIEFITNYT